MGSGSPSHSLWKVTHWTTLEKLVRCWTNTHSQRKALNSSSQVFLVGGRSWPLLTHQPLLGPLWTHLLKPADPWQPNPIKKSLGLNTLNGFLPPPNLLDTEGHLQPQTAHHINPKKRDCTWIRNWREVTRGLIELGGNLLLSTMKKEFWIYINIYFFFILVFF
jgi:hypothetical protein